MASSTENEIEIIAIKQELAKTKKVSELSVSQRRQMLSDLYGGTLPPMKYNNELVAIGDKVYGKGVSAINSGGFFMGDALFVPISLAAHVDQDIQF
tara:strand:- start:731 stop:1018 length:288 start_codon:yes stop_codon:yes gene_type:complete